MAVYKNMKDYEKKLKKWMQEYPDDMVKANRQAAEIVRAEVIQHHLNGPKMPKGIGSRTRGTLQPQSGRLKNSITTMAFREGRNIKAYIGNMHFPLKYAARHEFGDPIMPCRSFLRSSLEKKKQKVLNWLQKAMKRSYTDA